MLRSLLSLKHFRINATDGQIGSVVDFYFDDEHWIIRYLVVSTSWWRPMSKVLIPLASVVESSDWQSGVISVNRTVEQVKDSPTLDQHWPVSRQEESKLLRHFHFPLYWWPTGVPQSAAIGSLDSNQSNDDSSASARMENESSDSYNHLRSAAEVSGYYVNASDNRFGHVADLIVDDQSWSVRYLVIDTVNWMPSKQVLIAPTWNKEIDWSNHEFSIAMSEAEIKQAPEYNPMQAVNRDLESKLYDYYGRPVYWSDNQTPHL